MSYNHLLEGDPDTETALLYQFHLIVGIAI